MKYTNGPQLMDDRIKILERSREVLLAEAEKRFVKEVRRVEQTLLSAPSREKYLQHEIDILYRILYKDIDYRNDCKRAGQTYYYHTGRFEWDVRQIESVRHHYRLYLQDKINYIGSDPATDPKAENIILAIVCFKLEEYLNKGNRWQNLFHDLNNAGYIKTTPEVFVYVMNNKHLPEGADKISWLTQKSDAMYFANAFGLKIAAQLNRCFLSVEGTPFHGHNRTTTKPREPLPAIIKKYVDNIEA